MANGRWRSACRPTSNNESAGFHPRIESEGRLFRIMHLVHRFDVKLLGEGLDLGALVLNRFGEFLRPADV